MPRGLTENITFYGTSLATGYTMEFLNDTFNFTGMETALLGVGGAVLGIAGNMLIDDERSIAGNATLGVGSSSLAWTGGKIRTEGLIAGAPQTAGAGGQVRTKALKVQAENNNSNSSSSSNSSNSNNNGSKKVVSM